MNLPDFPNEAHDHLFCHPVGKRGPRRPWIPTVVGTTKIFLCREKYFRALYWEGEGGLAPTLAFSNRCGSPPWAEDLIRIDQALDERDRQRLENAGEGYFYFNLPRAV